MVIMMTKLTIADLYKVITMFSKRFFVVILLLALGCQQVSISKEIPPKPANDSNTEAELDTQLKINREVLLKSPDEQNRTDAASVMLNSENQMARKILIDVLNQSENPEARAAVCRALVMAVENNRPVQHASNFIGSLLRILRTEAEPDIAKLAAEATLIFEYKQISETLEKVASDASLPMQARLNTIYALKLQPDKKAIFKLMDLLGDPDDKITSASEQALTSLGIPVGKDARERKRIKEELQRKGRKAFLRDWQIRQDMEKQMRLLEQKENMWRERYLATLDQIYEVQKDDTAKGAFLVEKLADPEPTVRLWALAKVERWRVGTSKLPAELGPVLVGLVSDADRNVRLKTAELLAFMEQLNSSEKLLEQFKAEQDDEVKLKIFVALGRACSYAFLPTSAIELPSQVRKETLEIAAQYLSEDQIEKTQKGAEVIKNLLEGEQLAPDDDIEYLDLLVERYKQADKTLRGELLNIMAGLCAQSAYKAEAAERFLSLFKKALHDDTDLVREAAVNGLINIDKSMALKSLRPLINDNSFIIKKKIIALAGEVGNEADLVWLAGKTRTPEEADPAWQAMLGIFKDSDVKVLNQWITNFSSQDPNQKISSEKMIVFLEIAKRKANGETKSEIMKDVQERLAELYSSTGDFEKAASSFSFLHKQAKTDVEKQRFLGKLLSVYLKKGDLQLAGSLIANRLLQKDLEPDDIIVVSIDSYFNGSSAESDSNALFKVLSEIEFDEPKPIWAEQIKRWSERFGRQKAEKTDKSRENDNK